MSEHSSLSPRTNGLLFLFCLLLLAVGLAPLLASAQDDETRRDPSLDRISRFSQSLLARYDTDRDGQVSCDENSQMRSPIRKSADIDQDGFFTLKEIYAHYSADRMDPVYATQTETPKNEVVQFKATLYQAGFLEPMPEVNQWEELKEKLIHTRSPFSAQAPILLEHPSTFQIGRRQPQVVGVSTGRSGTRQRTVSMTDMGTILKITPTKTADDKFLAKLELEHSDEGQPGPALEVDEEEKEVSKGPAEILTLIYSSTLPVESGEPAVAVIKQQRATWYLVVEME